MNRPYLNIDSGGAILFDGLAAVCWFIHMRSNVTSARVTNIAPGELYTFVITQDATGGHVMNWPSNCINAAQIDPTPNSTTVQNFIGNTGAILFANIPPSRTKGTP
jgi:hypothetical protein